jgi:hypothetical protein
MNEKTKNRLKGLAKMIFGMGFPIFCSITKEESSIVKDPTPIYLFGGLIVADSLGELITGRGDYSVISEIMSTPSKIIHDFNERRNMKYLL